MIKILLFLLTVVIPHVINATTIPTTLTPKRALIVGASVGMGKELAKLLANNGYIVGMTARRVELLKNIQQEIPTQTYINYMDMSDPDDAINRFIDLIEKMGGLDLMVIAATGFWDCDFQDNNWKKSRPVLTVDVVGFFALAHTALNFFESQGYGHLVGFSSIDGIRGIANQCCQLKKTSQYI